jgi:hypothetical protein
MMSCQKWIRTQRSPCDLELLLESQSEQHLKVFSNLQDKLEINKWITEETLHISVFILPTTCSVPNFSVIFMLNYIYIYACLPNACCVSIKFSFGQSTFLFCHTQCLSRPALLSTQPPIQWVLGALSPGGNQQGHETDHSPPNGTEIKQM